MIEQLPWREAVASKFSVETDAVKTISLDVRDWPGHRAGQHVDVRLTADDGYVAQRSYSLGTRAGTAQSIDLTVERVPDGEVSPFLHDVLQVGEAIEVRGPIGGYFTWEPNAERPLMLVAGGSGIVPLMSMLRTWAAAPVRPQAALLYSSRSQGHIIYRGELDELRDRNDAFRLSHSLTRGTPPDWRGETGRIGRATLERHGFAPLENPAIYVCGPTPFVEAISEALLGIGHQEQAVRTERFGPSGGGA